MSDFNKLTGKCFGCSAKTKYVYIYNQKIYDCCKYGYYCQKEIELKVLEKNLEKTDMILNENIKLSENILLKGLK